MTQSIQVYSTLVARNNTPTYVHDVLSPGFALPSAPSDVCAHEMRERGVWNRSQFVLPSFDRSSHSSDLFAPPKCKRRICVRASKNLVHGFDDALCQGLREFHSQNRSYSLAVRTALKSQEVIDFMSILSVNGTSSYLASKEVFRTGVII